MNKTKQEKFMLKRIFVLFLILALVIPFAVACRDTNEPEESSVPTENEDTPKGPLDGKKVVYNIGFKDLAANALCDRSTEEAVFELSTQIIKCRIVERTKVVYTEHGTLSFQYLAEVEEIYLDVTENIKKGDFITVSSAEGILTVEEAAEIIPDTKFSSFDESKYNKDDYVVSSLYDGIPIEAGISHIMFLYYYEDEDVYADCGFSYMYGIYDGIYQGAEAIKLECTLEEIEDQIEKGVSKRSGRLEEIGRTELMKELGKKQAEEKRVETET